MEHNEALLLLEVKKSALDQAIKFKDNLPWRYCVPVLELSHIFEAYLNGDNDQAHIKMDALTADLKLKKHPIDPNEDVVM